MAVVWSGAILCFIAGVRRGLSFDTRGGPAWAELSTVLWLFALGIGGLALAVWSPAASIGLLLLGYASFGVARGARAGEAPRFFSRVRPAQAALAVASLAVLLVLVSRG